MPAAGDARASLQADAERALTLKSFDYRVLARNPELSWIAAPQRGRLPGSPAHAAGPGASRWAPPSPLAAQNLLLYALRGAEPDPLALAFLAESEVLVEAADDLLDYEDDVLRNAFNVFRCLVHLHGAPPPRERRSGPMRVGAGWEGVSREGVSALADARRGWNARDAGSRGGGRRGGARRAHLSPRGAIRRADGEARPGGCAGVPGADGRGGGSRGLRGG